MTLDKKWREPNEEEKQEIVNQMKTYWKSLCLIMAIAEIFYICKFISKAQVALKNNDIATMFVTILTIIISIVLIYIIGRNGKRMLYENYEVQTVIITEIKNNRIQFTITTDSGEDNIIKMKKPKKMELKEYDEIIVAKKKNNKESFLILSKIE